MILREGKLEELNAIVHLVASYRNGDKREILGDEPAPCYVKAFRGIMDDPNSVFFVAVDENAPKELLGCLQVSFVYNMSHQGAKRAVIENVRIRSDLRGKGLGTQMMKLAIGYAEKNGAQIVQLISGKALTEAHQFYRKLGFEATHEGFKLEL